MSGRNRTEIISTLVVAILTSYRWPMGDEGKQAMLQGGVAGPPPYPGPWGTYRGRAGRPAQSSRPLSPAAAANASAGEPAKLRTAPDPKRR